MSKKQEDISDQSIVLLWFKARHESDFELYQNIGDWVFFSSIYFPQSVKCSMNFYQGIGKSSYHTCHNFLNGKWPLYEELSDKFEYFVSEIRNNHP